MLPSMWTLKLLAPFLFDLAPFGHGVLRKCAGDLNPASCLSRVDLEWKGQVPLANEGAVARCRALEALQGVPSSVWILGFPKGRRGAANNFDCAAL